MKKLILITKKYNIKLFEGKKYYSNWNNQDYLFYFLNNCYFIAPNIIIMGNFKDNQLKLACFFHELGHFLDTKKYKNLFIKEKNAWKFGFAIAKKELNLSFANYIKKICEEKLNSYKK